MEEKAGYKTTEFWLSTAALIVGTLLAAGVWGEGDAVYRVLGFLASALSALGYSHGRAKVKTAAILTAPKAGIGTSPAPAQDSTVDPT